MDREYRRDMAAETRQAVAAAVRDGRGRRGVEAEAVSGAVVGALHGGHVEGAGLLALAAGTVSGAVYAAAEQGIELERAASSIMVGTLQGIRRVGTPTTEIVRISASTLVVSAADIGANVAGAARGAVAGAMKAGPDLGFTIEQAAVAAAAGALEAAGDVGSMERRETREALAELLFRPREYPEDPTPGGMNGM